MISRPTIIDRGRGPEIAGTRITVFHVLEYQLAGAHRDAIAASFGLSSDQVDAAVEYIRQNQEEVTQQYARIRERIELGNTPEIEARFRESQAKLAALRQRLGHNGSGSDANAGRDCVGQ